VVHAYASATSGNINQISANATANIKYKAELKVLQVPTVGPLHIQKALPPVSLIQQAYCVFFFIGIHHARPLYQLKLGDIVALTAVAVISDALRLRTPRFRHSARRNGNGGLVPRIMNAEAGS
jgi:hypothetical protein